LKVIGPLGLRLGPAGDWANQECHPCPHVGFAAAALTTEVVGLLHSAAGCCKQNTASSRSRNRERVVFRNVTEGHIERMPPANRRNPTLHSYATTLNKVRTDPAKPLLVGTVL
jgi:hypothetical protein